MIIPFLSSRLALFSVYVRPTITALQCARFKHSVLDETLLAQKLGIPVRPKKPATAYFRYLDEQRPLIKAKHPELKMFERTVLIAKMWNSLDAANKEKYFKSHADETVLYRKQLIDYYEKITEDDKQKLQAKLTELKEEIDKRKKARSQQKKRIELDRPVRPVSGYMKFFSTNQDRKPNETLKQFVTRKGAEWKSMSESQQAAYKVPAEDIEKYKKEYQQWADKMRFSDNHNVTRRISKRRTKYADILNAE